MSEPDDHLTDRVRAFYERYHFPSIRPLEQDGLILLRRLLQTVARRRAAEPDRSVRVLDAGCGTGNTMLALARQMPEAQFLGIDLSQPSLDVARAAVAEVGLGNVRVRQGDLREPLDDEEPFDVVLCMGVLHHTADMRLVLSRLRGALAPHGELYLWMYGRHGRYRHRLNARLLAMLLHAGNGDDDPIPLAREFLAHAGGGMALADLRPATDRIAAQAEVLHDPAWLADQFLHPHDAHVDLEQLLPLIDAAGLTLTEWLGVDTRPERYLDSPGLLDRFRRLEPRQQLVALDLVLKPDRYFVCLGRDAP
jgi:SAM-dependent methyltransferase